MLHKEDFPARPDKTINWLGKSRDEWKQKSQITKSELKVSKQAQKRARQSREEWKKEYQKVKKENRQQERTLEEKDEEIFILKTEIQNLKDENNDLKKKYLLRLMTKK